MNKLIEKIKTKLRRTPSLVTPHHMEIVVCECGAKWKDINCYMCTKCGKYLVVTDIDYLQDTGR